MIFTRISHAIIVTFEITFLSLIVGIIIGIIGLIVFDLFDFKNSDSPLCLLIYSIMSIYMMIFKGLPSYFVLYYSMKIIGRAINNVFIFSLILGLTHGTDIIEYFHSGFNSINRKQLTIVKRFQLPWFYLLRIIIPQVIVCTLRLLFDYIGNTFAEISVVDALKAAAEGDFNIDELNTVVAEIFHKDETKCLLVLSPIYIVVVKIFSFLGNKFETKLRKKYGF